MAHIRASIESFAIKIESAASKAATAWRRVDTAGPRRVEITGMHPAISAASGALAVPILQQEPQRIGSPVQAHKQVPRLLDHPGYEAGEQQPLLSLAVAIADALNISIAQLAGKINHDLDLAGDWWCAWQTWKDGASRIDTHPLRVDQRGELLQLDADRAIPVEEGSYRWRGELRLWDSEALIGWYHSTDAP